MERKEVPGYTEKEKSGDLDGLRIYYKQKKFKGELFKYY